MNKIFKKVTLVLMMITLFAMGLISCGNSNRNSAKNESSIYPLTLTDSYGEEVTLDKVPEKIVSAAPNMTELVYKLGAGDKLVGRTKYCDYPEEALNVESIGTLKTPDIEKIISLEPDLVLASTHFNEENAQKLENAGIKVLSLYEENNVDGVYTMIDTLGKALNKQSEADKTIEEMKSTINEVTEKVSKLEAPTVYYVVGFGDGGNYTAPENTFVGQLIKLAGGNNIVPASDSWSYSLEALIEADPEIIVVRKGEKEAFKSAPAYNNLTAVKNDKVYEIDNNLLDRQGYRNAEGVKNLAEIFHPEAFK